MNDLMTPEKFNKISQETTIEVKTGRFASSYNFKNENEMQEYVNTYFRLKYIKSENKKYILINENFNGELYYGFCEEYNVFIGWDKEKNYYLVNEQIEIIKEIDKNLVEKVA